MRIFTDKAEHYIQSLATSIAKDPASLELWRCIHVQYHGEALPSQVTAALLNTLRNDFKDSDCDVVFCKDHDLLLIGRSNELDGLHLMQETAMRELTAYGPVETQLYDLFYGWREIRRTLLDKLDDKIVMPLPDDTADFGDIASFSEVFDAVRKRRKSRNPLHVMLVEDDEMTRRLVSGLFKEKYAVITAKDAQEAIANYLMYAPDIVFLDINLPDHNGFQVLKQILENDPEAYVVMFSGNSYLDNITHALNAGASGFVAKPFSKEKMRHYIEDCAFASGKQVH